MQKIIFIIEQIQKYSMRPALTVQLCHWYSIKKTWWSICLLYKSWSSLRLGGFSLGSTTYTDTSSPAMVSCPSPGLVISTVCACARCKVCLTDSAQPRLNLENVNIIFSFQNWKWLHFCIFCPIIILLSTYHLTKILLFLKNQTFS